MSDSIAVMNAGRFEQMGTARDLYYRPQTAFVAGFVGDANRWQGRVIRAEGEALEVKTDGGLILRAVSPGRTLALGDRVEVFVRPEAIRLAENAAHVAQFDTQISGHVAAILFNGAASRVIVTDASGAEIEVTLPQSGEFAHLTRGAPVHVGWSGDQGNAFAATGL